MGREARPSRPGLVVFAVVVASVAAAFAGTTAIVCATGGVEAGAGEATVLGAVALGFLVLAIALWNGRPVGWWLWLLLLIGVVVLRVIAAVQVASQGLSPALLILSVLIPLVAAVLLWAWCRAPVRGYFGPRRPREPTPPRIQVLERVPAGAAPTRITLAPPNLELLQRRHQYYEILELSPTASGAEVLAALERFRVRWPANRYPGAEPIAEEAWSHIQRANRRQAYDLARAALRSGSDLRARIVAELRRRGKAMADPEEVYWVMLWEPCYNQAEVEIQRPASGEARQAFAERLRRLTDYMHEWFVKHVL